jgi:hypothetical protein
MSQLKFILWYIKNFLIMVFELILVFWFILGLIALLIELQGCGEEYVSSYSSSSYRACEDICEDLCNTCWSWSSDILICERECSSECRIHGCDYISVSSLTCDRIFQEACKF